MPKVDCLEKVDLFRSYFTKLQDGSGTDNFDWLLGELGISENEHGDIDSITISIDGAEYEKE